VERDVDQGEPVFPKVRYEAAPPESHHPRTAIRVKSLAPSGRVRD
jgi:hypothetical protein